jgi:hypothetical protein
MPQSLSDFLIEISQDANRLHEYVTNREQVIDESDLSDEHKDLLKNSEHLNRLKDVHNTVREELADHDEATPMLIFIVC